jgi:hypothetical protein
MGKLAIIGLILTFMVSGVAFASDITDNINLTVEVSRYAKLNIENKNLGMAVSMSSPDAIPEEVETSIMVGHNYDVLLSFASRGFQVGGKSNTDLDDLVIYRFDPDGRNNVTFSPGGGNTSSPVSLNHGLTNGSFTGVFRVGFAKSNYINSWVQVAAGTYQDVITVTVSSPD